MCSQEPPCQESLTGVPFCSVFCGLSLLWLLLLFCKHTAARAGVFVSVAGCNSGPGASTVCNNAPGAITVAASTLPRSLKAGLRLGDGTLLEGAGLLFTPVGPLPLVYGGGATSTTKSQLCAPDSLDPSQVTGKAVVSLGVGS